MASDGQIVFEVTADGKHAIADIKDITKAIQQYLKAPSHGYALFINGHWGIGKTHYIKNIHEKLKDLQKKKTIIMAVDNIDNFSSVFWYIMLLIYVLQLLRCYS